LAYDIDSINKNKEILSKDWQKRLPYNSTPYTSTIVFLVRKGNPKNIKDWDDLARPGWKLSLQTPRLQEVHAGIILRHGICLKKYGNDPEKAKEFVKAIYANVPVLDSGARGSTTTFVERGLGDVLIAWENEAFLSLNELGKDKFELLYRL